MRYLVSNSQPVPSYYSSIAPGSNYAKPTCSTTKPTCKPTKPTCDVDSSRDNVCKPTKPTCDIDQPRDNVCKPTCDVDSCQDHCSSYDAYYYGTYTNSCDADMFLY